MHTWLELFHISLLEGTVESHPRGVSETTCKQQQIEIWITRAQESWWEYVWTQWDHRDGILKGLIKAQKTEQFRQELVGIVKKKMRSM